jgi:hypothetical protein
MVLEQIVIDILKKEYDKIKTQVPHNGMFDSVAKKIVKDIKQALVD